MPSRACTFWRPKVKFRFARLPSILSGVDSTSQTTSWAGSNIYKAHTLTWAPVLKKRVGLWPAPLLLRLCLKIAVYVKIYHLQAASLFANPCSWLFHFIRCVPFYYQNPSSMRLRRYVVDSFGQIMKAVKRFTWLSGRKYVSRDWRGGRNARYALHE